jgi:hypothetical protein
MALQRVELIISFCTKMIFATLNSFDPRHGRFIRPLFVPAEYIFFDSMILGAHTKGPALETSHSKNVPSLKVQLLKRPTAQNVPL